MPKHTLQSLYDDHLFIDDLDPQLVYACLEDQYKPVLWYFLGYRMILPNNPLTDPMITKERLDQGLKRLRDFLVFFVQHPGHLLEASSEWSYDYNRYIWIFHNQNFYLYPIFGWADLNTRPYQTIDQIIGLVLAGEGKTIWRIIPPTTLTNREKQDLHTLKIISCFDYDHCRDSLRQHPINLEGELQLNIQPLVGHDDFTFRMIGDYLYIATMDDIFYYCHPDSDLIMTILDQHANLLRTAC